jgi:hypothetical protein
MRDRDQLWAEAAMLEAQGVSIVLDPALWAAAGEEQERRRIRDPWEDVVEAMPPARTIRNEWGNGEEVQIIYQSDGKELVASADVMAHVLGVPAGHQHPEHGRRLARVMPRCGWQTSESGRVRFAGKQVRGYWRDALPAAAPEEWKVWRPEKRDDACNDWHGDARKVNGKAVVVKKAKTEFWYVIRDGELLGQAGCLQRFSTNAEAKTAIDQFEAGADGWEWIASE